MSLIKKPLTIAALAVLVICLVFGVAGCNDELSKDGDATTSGSSTVSTHRSKSNVSSSNSSAGNDSSSLQTNLVDWTDNWEANGFITGFNEAYPNNVITKKDVKAFENGAGDAADVKMDDIVCRFSYSDGDPTLSILSKLSLDKNGRSKFFKQAAKAVAIRYDLSIETANRIMNAFDNGKAKQLGDEGEHKIYDSDGLSFLFTTDNDGYNYDLFTYKETRY